MDPSGHDLHNISMFTDTMWRGGFPYHGGSAKTNPDTTKAIGRIQENKGCTSLSIVMRKVLREFLLITLFNTLLSIKIWILKWLREFEIGKNNWPAWMHAYLEHY